MLNMSELGATNPVLDLERWIGASDLLKFHRRVGPQGPKTAQNGPGGARAQGERWSHGSVLLT